MFLLSKIETISFSKSSVRALLRKLNDLRQGKSSIRSSSSFIADREAFRGIYRPDFVVFGLQKPERSIFVIMWWGSNVRIFFLEVCLPFSYFSGLGSFSASIASLKLGKCFSSLDSSSIFSRLSRMLGSPSS
jgi:hypothetical protein